METNPLVPRQRNRRADRQPAEPQTFQPATPVTQPPVPQHTQPFYQQVAPVQQPVQPQQYVQPQQFVQYQSPVQQPVYPQTPRTMYQQPANQTTAPSQPQYAPRPRVLNQSGTVNSGWQQPTMQPRIEVPHARAGRSLSKQAAREAKAAQREAEDKARQEAKKKAEWEAEKARRAEEKNRYAEEKTSAKSNKKLPGWLTTAISLAFIAVLALVAADNLMQAYLVTEENDRIAAYEAVLKNYHVTEQPDGTLKVTWQDYIEKYAAQYNLQPAFVTAIIRHESSFRTNAESSVGARGLMQMMPDTAEWIAGKLDDNNYHYDNMWEAEHNIRYGCWYLGYLSRLFHGDPVLISAAYHAGQTTVTQWLSDRTKSADGVTLDPDKLADGPTKQYIGRVTQTYGIYQTLLYPAEAFGAVSAGSSTGAAGDR